MHNLNLIITQKRSKMFNNPAGNTESNKNRPKRNHPYLTIAIPGIILLISFMFTTISCSGLIAPSEKIDVAEESGETAATGDSSMEMSEDTMAVEEEALPEIDYQNATVGAEMVGSIPSFLCTNRDNYIKIQITNTSDFTWRNERPGVVRIGYHYYGQDVDYVDYDGTNRTLLQKDVEPGETISVIVLINDIINPGTYVIQIDPVLEGNEIPENNFWFSSKGVEMIQGPVYFGICGEQEE